MVPCLPGSGAASVKPQHDRVPRGQCRMDGLEPAVQAPAGDRDGVLSAPGCW